MSQRWEERPLTWAEQYRVTEQHMRQEKRSFQVGMLYGALAGALLAGPLIAVAALMLAARIAGPGACLVGVQ